MDTPYRVEEVKKHDYQNHQSVRWVEFEIVRTGHDFSCVCKTATDARIVVDALNLVEHLAQVKIKP